MHLHVSQKINAAVCMKSLEVVGKQITPMSDHFADASSDLKSASLQTAYCSNTHKMFIPDIPRLILLQNCKHKIIL